MAQRSNKIHLPNILFHVDLPDFFSRWALTLRQGNHGERVFTRRSGGAANGWTMPFTVPKVTFFKFLFFVLFIVYFHVCVPCVL
jgi:hypothetical protein